MATAAQPAEANLRFEDLATRIQPIQGLIPREWHRHQNLDNSLGGWVRNTATVDPTAVISSNAIILDCARVLGHAKILGSARVGGGATVSDHAIVCEDAEVTDMAQVMGKCILRGRVMVRGDVVLRSGEYCEGVIRALNHGVRPGPLRQA